MLSRGDPWGEEKTITIIKEVGRLVNAQFVKEIRFQTWVKNPVLVKNILESGGCASTLEISTKLVQIEFVTPASH